MDTTLTWRTPELLQFKHRFSPSLLGQWFVSRKSNQIEYTGYGSDSVATEYLRSDGTWCGSMGFDGSIGGTYFKTLEEAILVLVEFEIDVTGKELQ